MYRTNKYEIPISPKWSDYQKDVPTYEQLREQAIYVAYAPHVWDTVMVVTADNSAVIVWHRIGYDKSGLIYMGKFSMGPRAFGADVKRDNGYLSRKLDETILHMLNISVGYHNSEGKWQLDY